MQRRSDSKSLQELIDNYNAEIMRYSRMAQQADADSVPNQRKLGEQQRESGEEAIERGNTERDYWLAEGKQGLQNRMTEHRHGAERQPSIHMPRPEAHEPIYRPGSNMPRPEPDEPLEMPMRKDHWNMPAQPTIAGINENDSDEQARWMREVELSLIELRQLIDELRGQNITSKPEAQKEAVTQAPIEPIASDDRRAQSEQSIVSDGMGVGYLQVGVYTARQSNPVPNARVTVFRETAEGRELYASASTNDDGKIPLIQIPVGTSSADNVNAPFEIYNVSVAAEGYYPRNELQAQIFDGITALLWVEVTPQPDSAWPPVQNNL